VVPGSRLHRWFLVSGALGPLLFAVTYTIDGATRPGYDALRDTVSALSLGPGGWIQIANFVVFGVLTAISVVAWRAALSPGWGASMIPITRGLLAVGLIIAGVCVTDASGDGPSTLHGALHNAASSVALTATWCSAFLFAARFAREPGWRVWSVLMALSGLAIFGSLAGMGIAIAEHGNVGLFERLGTLLSLPLGLAVTARLLAVGCRVSQTGR
jgi:hypothetical protein